MNETATAPDPDDVPPIKAPDSPLGPLFQNQPTNEPLGQTEDANQAKGFKGAIASGRKVFAKFKLPWGGSGAVPEGVEVALGSDAVPGSAPAPEFRDPMLIKRSMAAIGKAVRKFADKVVYRKALEATGGDKGFAQELQSTTSASDEACEAFGDVMDIVLKECGLDTKYLPLLMAGTLVVGASAQYYVCIRDLNRQIAVRKVKEDLRP